jgi:hypothetical protein
MTFFGWPKCTDLQERERERLASFLRISLLHSPAFRSELQGGHRVPSVHRRGGEVDEHQDLGVLSESILQKERELRVPVRDVSLLRSEALDNIAQCGEGPGGDERRGQRWADLLML